MPCLTSNLCSTLVLRDRSQLAIYGFCVEGEISVQFRIRAIYLGTSDQDLPVDRSAAEWLTSGDTHGGNHPLKSIHDVDARETPGWVDTNAAKNYAAHQ